ncbi:hypothetical protein GCM10022225_51740 [Plantactinospora mayteni]|uniref:Uncharacterized protein n=1 Tax=Plantactinospora mayteni TaxID=566021 RepID=A0ABQ4EZ26_9ACTN|nr:hypothetical protein [Plantactinospora mayteni]GIG99909.1 hypothetical protein Pma05_64820 [Plantactinospora mayteni]
MSRSEPGKVAERFAKDLINMLNRTVCEGAFVGILERPDGMVVFGTELRRGQRPQPIPMRTRGGVPCWLTVSGQVFLDGDGYLTVKKSNFLVSAGKPALELFHYDYERDKIGYPDAHLQIFASGEAWDELLLASGKSGGSVSKLHLPVGGRRYRVALEDIIEALIAEDILEPQAGWKPVLERSRDDFRRRQLAAAVRRDPSTAVAELQARGYTVAAPDQALVGNVVQFSKTRLRRRLGRRKPPER